MADPFVAEIRIFPFNFAPKGWAWCDGQLLPLSQNTALFSLLGTTYGGNGKSNFALPDLQGRAPMHPGQGPGLSLHDLGETGGSETVTLLESEIPAHAHILRASPDDADLRPERRTRWGGPCWLESRSFGPRRPLKPAESEIPLRRLRGPFPRRPDTEHLQESVHTCV